MVEPDQREADAGRKIVFSYGFVRDSDMEAKVMLYDDTTLIIGFKPGHSLIQ